MALQLTEKFKKELEKNKKIFFLIKAVPCSPKPGIKNILNNQIIKIHISSPPEKEKANKELKKILSQEFSVPVSNIQIIKGKAKKLKLIKITS